MEIKMGKTKWDDMQERMQSVRNALDEADSCKFGDMGKLLDLMAKNLDIAIDLSNQLRPHA